MFYRNTTATGEIKQGDIFKNLPFGAFDLENLSTIHEDGNVLTRIKWEDIQEENSVVGINVKKVSGIVVSQDCDNLRNEFVTFALVRPLTEVTNQRPQSDLNWTKLIRKGPRESNYQWFYLPSADAFGINQRMAVDFDALFQLPKSNIMYRRRMLRHASLGESALKHFRDSWVKYFTRYAHDEWYSFTKEEFEAYKSDIISRDPDEGLLITPLPYQR